ncbi:MAG: DNA polymerase III subunit gamma/tau [Chloroflexota bacterium]|nr:DNA polymerase III subunit gamma/tau [Chloroflexota bacterium]
MAASQVFYRKWRPQTLAEVVGQEQVTQTLLNALKSGRVSHAYLFCGPRGTGKTSTGRILAKAVNCLTSGKGEPCNTCLLCQAVNESRAPDVIEIDAASNTGVDDIRNLRERVNYAPNQSRYKVYIIDEVHMLSTSASNALLKTLEEPPPYVIFILATTEAHKVLPTVQSRCQRFDFRRLTQTDVVAKLAGIAKAEGIQIQPEALRLVARSAAGSLRDAENLLEQLTTYYGAEVTLQQTQTMLGITGDWRAKELVKHLVNNDITAGITTISSVNSDGLDLRQFTREMVEYLRGLLLVKTGASDTVDFTAEEIVELKALAAKAPLPQILKAVKIFGQIDLSFDNYSTLPLELALVDCILTEEKKETRPRPDEPEPVKPARVAAPSPTVTQPQPTAAEPVKPARVTPPQVAVPVQPKPPAARPEPTVAKPEPPRETPPLKAGAAAAAPPLSSETEQARLNWRQIIEQAPENTRKTPAMAILRSAGVRVAKVEGDAVVLAFKYPIHKEQIEKLENQQTVEKIIGHFLGRPCHVRCVHEPENNHLVKAALKMGAQITKTEEK